MQKSNLGRCRLWSGGGQKQQTREKRSMAKKVKLKVFQLSRKSLMMTCLSWFQLFLEAGAANQPNQIV